MVAVVVLVSGVCVCGYFRAWVLSPPRILCVLLVKTEEKKKKSGRKMERADQRQTVLEQGMLEREREREREKERERGRDGEIDR